MTHRDSRHRRSDIRRALLVLPLLLPLAACGEDDDPDPFVAGPSQTTDGAADVGGESFPAGAPVNGPLSGRLLVFNDPNSYALDLATGRWTPLDGQGFVSTLERFPDSRGRTWLLPDSSAPGRSILTAKGCREGQTCVGFLDENAGLRGFALHDEVRDSVFTRAGQARSDGSVKRSRDGRYIAYSQADSTLFVGELRVTDVIGQEPESRTSYDVSVVSSTDIGLQTGSPYDWLPSGGLLFSQDTGELSQRIVLARSQPASTTVASSIELTGYRGSVREISVSPDGNFAMLRFIESLNEIPLVIDLRTDEVFEPVSRTETPFLDIGGIVWSPDSRWLMFRLQQATNLDALVPSAPLDAPSGTISPKYAVRVDGRSRAVPRTVDDSNDGARLVLARPFDDPNGPLGPQYVTIGNHWVQ